ncbi:flagellar biosynthetic protein FliR [Hoeflea prorocentri]|uniref:Flagellar biosynthetic protein FliR n=1 Tax=Hoeflea prorocentri TaxID=1922333 RepID=A0A9X3UKS6_9HYPH|nr:flagellar biosynthetic protein FliR [Hoeflea prorocentri]MCY6382372.1 flagellar biosynthetic protein FliR [Hoeflea prorocentri]MDA5400172.1 flagellar biosynthetic protein FliR [Hoeflea prorocentri]
MITDPEGTVLALFASFCRVGACFMIMPGLGSARVPPQVRLFVAIAASMALLPLMWQSIYPKVETSTGGYVSLVVVEILIGSVLGLVARFYVLALQFAGTAVSMMIGFNAMASAGLESPDPQTELGNLIALTGLLILFMLDFHHIVIEALAMSYELMPVGGSFDPQMALVTLSDTLSASFMTILRLISPFIIYGLIFNLAVGMVNKLAPQIPVYFISLPFILTGGLFLLFFGSGEFFSQFADGFVPVFDGR